MTKTAIVNVVATAALNQKLDLDELGKVRGIFHDSAVYGGRVAYVNTPEMEGKVSLFASGKMISVGTKSEDAAFHELAVAKHFLVEKKFINDVSLQPKVQNMVVSVDLGTAISLEDLSLKKKIIYEPEQFPGAILKIAEPYKATALIFASGKAVVTGLTTTNQIDTIVESVSRLLEKADRVDS